MIRPLPRWRAAVAAIALLLLPAAAPSQASAPAPTVVHFFAADTTQTGVISLVFFGAEGAPVTYAERVGDRLEPLGVRTAAPGEPTTMREATTWRCDRLVRRFEAAALLPDGTRAVGAYSVRTPSCATRLRLDAPRRVDPGAVARIRISDSWGLGAIRARLCVRAPRATRDCRSLRLATAVTSTRHRVRVTTPGRWDVELVVRGHRTRSSIVVGAHGRPSAPLPTVLTTGDSTMMGVDSFLADELAGVATVRSDVRPGTGIGKPDGPWARLPRRQATRLRPAATVVSIGAAEGFPITTPEGTTYACCDAGWVAEYSRRVRAAMRVYRRHGRGRVIWLTLPAMRGVRQRISDAVNLAVVQAAEGLSHVTVLRLDLVFSPAGYSETIRYRGRDIDVREPDGVHLNIAGTAIAAKLVAAALRAR